MGEDELRARFLAASRAFLRDPSEAALATLLSRYSLRHVAHHGSESGLDAELAKIEWNCRNAGAALMPQRPVFVRWCATEDGSSGPGTGRHIACFILEPATVAEI